MSFGPPRAAALSASGVAFADELGRSSFVTSRIAAGDPVDVAGGTALQDATGAGNVLAVVTDLPPHLWQVPVADGNATQLRAFAAVGDGRAVASFRRRDGKDAPSVAVRDTQLTRSAGPELVAPVAESDRQRAAASCSAIAKVGADALWCGWTTGHVSCYSTADAGCDLVESIFAHRGAVHGIAACADGTLVVTTATDTTATLWDVHTRQPLHTITPTPGAGHPRVAAVLNNIAFVGLDSGAVQAWSRDGSDHVTIASHRQATTAVAAVLAASEGRAVVWSGCDGGTVRATPVRFDTLFAIDDASGASHLSQQHASRSGMAAGSSLTLQLGRVAAVEPFAALDVPRRGAGGCPTGLLALVGTATGRLAGVRALDASVGSLVVLFVFDISCFSPRGLTARPHSDGSTRGGAVTPVTGIVRVSPAAVTVMLGSGAAVALLSPSTPPSAALRSGTHQPTSRTDDEARGHFAEGSLVLAATEHGAAPPDATYVPRAQHAALEGRYERALRTTHAVAQQAKGHVLRYKVAKEHAEMAHARTSVRSEELETQCGKLADALESTTAELQAVRRQAAEFAAAEARLTSESRGAAQTLRSWEAKCVELKKETEQQHGVLEALRRERDDLKGALDKAAAGWESAEAARREIAAKYDETAAAATEAKAYGEASRRRAINAEQRAMEAEEGIRESVQQLRDLTGECQRLQRELTERNDAHRVLQRLNSESTVELARTREALAGIREKVFASEAAAKEQHAAEAGSVEALRLRIEQLERDNARLRVAMIDREIEHTRSTSVGRAGETQPKYVSPPRQEVQASSTPTTGSGGYHAESAAGLLSPASRPGGATAESAAELLVQARRLMAQRRTSSPVSRVQTPPVSPVPNVRGENSPTGATAMERAVSPAGDGNGEEDEDEEVRVAIELSP